MDKRVYNNDIVIDEIMNQSWKDYAVDKIPYGVKKLTSYNGCTFNDRHYYIDVDNKCVYRYYSGHKIMTKRDFTKNKTSCVLADDDKRIVLYYGPKLIKHMNTESEFWDDTKINELKVSWK